MNEAANQLELLQGEDMIEKFENLKDWHMEQKQMNDDISEFFNDMINEEDVDDEMKELMKEIEEEGGQQVQVPNTGVKQKDPPKKEVVKVTA